MKKFSTIEDIFEEDQRVRAKARKTLINCEHVDLFLNTFRDDQRRLITAKSFLLNGCATTQQDFLQLAYIFHHSEFIPEYLSLGVLCCKISMIMGNKKSIWLYPRILDRFLLSISLPQKFGTHPGPLGFDTSDEERHQYKVPSLDKLLESGKLELVDWPTY